MHSISRIETQSILVRNGNLSIEAYFATSDHPKGAVIVLHEVFGVKCHLRSMVVRSMVVRSMVDRLASEDYGLVSPNMIQRSAPGLALDE